MNWVRMGPLVRRTPILDAALLVGARAVGDVAEGLCDRGDLDLLERSQRVRVHERLTGVMNSCTLQISGAAPLFLISRPAGMNSSRMRVPP